MEEQILNLNRQLTVFKAPVAVNRLSYSPQRQSRTGLIHSYMVLYYNTMGSCDLRLNFSRKIVLEKGHWALLDRNLLHEETVYGRCSGYCLGIEVESSLIASLFPALIREGWCESGSGGESVGWILERIRQENVCRPPGYLDYTDHLLSMLVTELCRASRDRNRDRGRSFLKVAPAEMVSRADSVAFVIDSFFNRIFQGERENLTLDALANALHMSQRNVNRILLKRYGMTFRQMLLLTRMRLAEYLLLQTDRPISEIGQLCDLSQAYLTRTFRQIYGLPPAHYRREHRKS